MGRVYKARDPRLDRTVAIKHLTESNTDRFRTEARAVAALNHPHICQVYDVGPDFLVLEYLEGSHPAGPMRPEQVQRLGRQLASALDAAHGRGILHRDLKPSNIILMANGAAKLLDFGVAKVLGPEPDVTRTGDGLVVGTIAYMSPEQALGKSLDHRSDIFSLGAVLYELLAGRRPFEGETSTQVLSALLHADPPPIQAPAPLMRVVMRCLAKNPAQRYQSAGELKRALEAPHETAAELSSIAVLPFTDLSGDKANEYFGDGLADEIINLLAQVPDLKVIARTSAFSFKGRNEDVRQIGRALGVTHVLEGGVRRAGDRVRVTTQLVAADDGSQVWSNRFDRLMADVFAMQDEIAAAIAVALKGKLAARSTVLRQHTPTVPAYEAVLRGRHFLFKFTPEGWRRARECFDEAVALDPTYAAPHAELAMGYFIGGMHGLQPLPEVAPVVRAKVERALALAPRDPLPRVLLGAIALVHDYDWAAADEQFRLAFEAPRISAEAHWIYASLYLGALGRFEQSSERMARAVDLDPLNASWRGVWSAHLQCANRLDQAIDEAKKAVELDEDYFAPRMILGEAYLHAGRIAEAVDALERAHRVGPWSAMTTGVFAAALALTGQSARAAALLATMSTLRQREWGRVWYHLHVGELDAAAEWYDKMIDVRDPFALVYANAPFMRPLHQHERWPVLAGRMNLPVDTWRQPR
jgi:serine/threonine-protein kinase